MGLTAGGCGLILGLDEFVDAPPGTGGAAGAGGASACEPEAVELCYEGEEGTEGVGNCVAGQRTCAADGAGWGSCEGQVLPAAEACAVRGDEDCDGNPCSDALWARVYGGAGYERATDVAVDGAGNVIIVGYFESTMDFGLSQQLITSGGKDYFLVRLDRDGTPLWAKQTSSWRRSIPTGR